MIVLSIVCILLAGALLALLDKLARTQPGGSRAAHIGEPGPPGGPDGGPARRSPLPPPIFDRTWHGL